ncbi:MAG: UMP kinase [Spirochaetaceae bacterium]|nr:UMP kinase [Spirochaetaceae bacterium]
MVKVISLGGSIVVPDQVDTEFLKKFLVLIKDYLDKDKKRKLIFVVGGGSTARAYQKAYREIVTSPDNNNQDWIGIAATKLNAELLKALFSNYCADDVVTDPTAEISFKAQVLVASGWKPGFSTDFDAVLLGERFKADTVVNLSNIAKVFSDDPKKNPNAVPLDKISWEDFKKIVGNEWIPGKNVPFDPIATAKAAELKMKVIVAAGKDIENLKLILEDKMDMFKGTIIG